MTDPREAAARYRARQHSESSGDESSEEYAPSGAAAAVDRAAFIESAIQVAIRRGDFDDLPGAGKPLEGLGDHHDPDWWIRRKTETERLSGLGPPAILLRTESKNLERDLDLLGREQDVRQVLEDFNRRVMHARRQLQGGPPVVTPTRDVDAEVAAWRERRAAASAPIAPTPLPPRRPRRWFRARRRP